MLDRLYTTNHAYDVESKYFQVTIEADQQT